ncbi:MAG: InlB B-repeat-containing protein [Clostridia bacterium]|nr:InlB B-repeat-containing protein [Clostridia bacterium]
MSKVKRPIALLLAFILMFSSLAVAGSAADTKSADIEIKMGKYENGEWVETTEVSPGEEVTARIFLTTDFYCGLGSFMFFYDSSFYEDEYTSQMNEVDVNPIYTTSDYMFEGTIQSSTGAPDRVKNGVAGIIGPENSAKYGWIRAFVNGVCDNMIFDGSDYLFEFNLKVKANASGMGYVTILPEAICSPTNPIVYSVNLSFGDADEGMGLSGYDMYSEEININVLPEDKGDYTEIVDNENQVSIITKFFREENGEWVETDKAKRGETLKARVYLESDYPTNGGELIFFYDNTFFTDSYSDSAANTLTVNTNAASFSGASEAFGTFYTDGSASAQRRVEKLVANNADLNADSFKDMGYFFVSYEFGDDYVNTPAYDDNEDNGADLSYEPELWFCEFELTVKDDAGENAQGEFDPDAEGRLDTIEETVASQTNVWGIINVPRGNEGDVNTYGMWLWDADVLLENNPVKLYSAVTFDADGGIFESDNEDVHEFEDFIGTTVTAEEPEKDGSVFLGWYEEGDQTQTLVDPVTEIPYDDITYVAKWTDEVTVNFDTQGGEPETGYSFTGGAGTEFPYGDVGTPTKDYYGFAGWAETPGGTPVALPSVFPVANKVYYALWEENTYKVQFIVEKPDGTTDTSHLFDVAYGDVIPLWTYTVPQGYTLHAWYTDEGYQTPFTEGTTMPGHNVTLYGYLEANKYNAIFDPNGGKIDGSEDPVTKPTAYLTQIEAPNDPVWPGHTFLGWTPQVGIMDVMEDKTFTATWEVVNYTFKYYESDSATEPLHSFTYIYGQTLDEVADPYIEGKTFAGWEYFKDDGSGTEVSIGTTMPDYNVKAVAQWVEYTLTINYQYENGEEAQPTYTKAITAGEDYSVATPAITGYTPSVDPVAGTMPEDNVTVTVTYVANKHDVTYDLAGGAYDGSTDDIVFENVAFGSPIPAPEDVADKLKKDGYDFAGWSPEVTGTMPDRDLDFVAQWTPKDLPLVINYIVEGKDTPFDSYETTVAFGESYEQVSPAKPGYELVDSTQATVSGNMDDPNGKTIPVYYKPIEYTLTVNYYIQGQTDPFRTTTDQVFFDAQYSVASPDVQGYTPDRDVVTGTMDVVGGKTESVYYTPNPCPLTITYKMSDDTTPPAQYQQNYDYNAGYSVDSPEVFGYEPDTATVSGTMNNPAGISVTVTYSPKNYNLIISYVDTEGGSVFPDYTRSVPYNTEYSVPSPEKTGYTPDIATVSGTMTQSAMTQNPDTGDYEIRVTVTYAKNTYDVTYELAGGEYNGSGNDIEFENVPFGDPVPQPDTNDITREGYTFTGWSKDVPGTMPAENLTFTAQWSKNSYTLTIKYETADGTTVHAPYTDTVEYEATYTVASPDCTAQGYVLSNPGQEPITGTMPSHDDEITVYYVLTSANININYVYEGGTTAAPPVSVEKNFGEDYSYDSPVIEGYEPDQATVSGTMGNDPVNVTVTYTPVDCTLTIKYIIQGQTEPFDTYTDTVKYDADYGPISSPTKTGYELVNASQASISGTISQTGETVIEVYYKPSDFPVKITYEMPDGTTPPTAVDETLPYGQEYNYTSPTVPGYKPDKEIVSGTMDENGVNETVHYTAIDYPLTINYVIEGESDPFDTHNEEVPYNQTYSVQSPEKTGYTPDQAVVSDTMDEIGGKTVTVTYTPKDYPVKITYTMSDGSTPPTAVDTTVPYGQDYAYDSPAVPGYTPEKATVSGTMDENGVNETVEYTPNNYPANFDPNGGKFGDSTDPVTINTPYNSDITPPAQNPTKEGSSFKGWSTDPNATEPDASLGKMDTPTADGKTFFAVWEVNDYTIFYSFEDATSTNPDPIGVQTNSYEQDVDYGEPFEVIADPANNDSNYSFESWAWYTLDGSEAAHGRTVPVMEAPGTYTYNGRTATLLPDGKPDTMPASDLLALAIWKGPGSAVFYFDYAKDTVRKVDEKTDADGVAITAPAQPDNPGYTFLGWAPINSDNTIGDVTDDFGTFETGKEKRFTAVWEDDLGTAEFYANGGTWSTGNDPETTEGNKTTAIKDPRDNGKDLSKVGSTFVGYGLTSTATPDEVVTDLGKYSDTVAKFYAIWEDNKLTLDYNGGVDSEGLTGPIGIEGFDAGDDISSMVPQDGQITNGDLVFDGWKDELGNIVTDPTKMPQGTHTWTAQWKSPGSFNINYFNPDGTTTHFTDTVPYGEATPALRDGPAVTGKTFKGWSETPNGTTPITALPGTMPAHDINLYAIYTDNEYTAKFDPNGGAWEGDTNARTDTYKYGDTVNVPTTPTAPGENYVFGGWEPADADSPATVPGTMPDKNISYKAKWTYVSPDQYTVTYQTENGDTYKVVPYNAGDLITSIPGPAKPGYKFTGWEWYKADGTTKIDKPTDMPAENLIAKPTYTPVQAGGYTGTSINTGAYLSRHTPDGSPAEYSGEYGGEYSAPTYSHPTGTIYEPVYEHHDTDHGEAVPHTGSNEGAAIFALVSAVAAAAYVTIAAKKKKEDD